MPRPSSSIPSKTIVSRTSGGDNNKPPFRKNQDGGAKFAARKPFGGSKKKSDSDSDQRRRPAGAVSLDSFANGKNGGKNKYNRHEKRERDMKGKAIQLKKYSKVAKQAGYGGDEERFKESKEKKETSDEGREWKKPDQFKKAREMAASKKEGELELVKEKDQKKVDLEAATLKRLKETKRMQRRTKSGQVVMKNVIGSLLDKIRKSVEEDESTVEKK